MKLFVAWPDAASRPVVRAAVSHPFLLRLPSTPLWHLEADGEGVKRGGGRAREAHSLGSIVIAGENKAWTQIQQFILALKSLRFQEMCDIRSSAIEETTVFSDRC